MNFFKRLLGKTKLLQNWHLPTDIQSYKMINNADFVQFVNANESRVLYFSTMVFNGNQLLSNNFIENMKPQITKTENGWEMKGIKHGGNEILVCVFSFTDEKDENWAMDLFACIEYIA